MVRSKVEVAAGRRMASTSSLPPTRSAPASSASLALSPVAKTATRIDLPVPCGKRDRTSHVLIGVTRIDAEAEGRLDGLVELGSGPGLDQFERLPRRILAGGSSNRFGAALNFLPCFGMSTPVVQTPLIVGLPRYVVVSRSALDGETHRAGGTFNDLHGRVDVVGIEVGHLDLGDLLHLGLRDRGHLLLVRFGEPLATPGGLTQQNGGRWRLGDEREAPILDTR